MILLIAVDYLEVLNRAPIKYPMPIPEKPTRIVTITS